MYCTFDFLLVLLVNGLPVLGPHEDGGVGEGGAAQSGARALDDGRRQDGDGVRGELGDVLGNAQQHTRSLS